MRFLGLILILTSKLNASPVLYNSQSLSDDRQDNWGVIEASLLYRSKKLSTNRLHNRILKHNLKSILCLAECKEEEKKLTENLKVKYFDLSMNISEITIHDAERIVRVLKAAPKPLLIHCRQGADRTGMAAALYFYKFKKLSMKSAKRKSLRMYYGHFHTWATHRIHEVLREYEFIYP